MIERAEKYCSVSPSKTQIISVTVIKKTILIGMKRNKEAKRILVNLVTEFRENKRKSCKIKFCFFSQTAAN